MVKESGETLDQAAIELGIYFVLVTLCMFMLLDQMGGKLNKLGRYLLRRRLEAFKYNSRNTKSVEMVLSIGCYSFIAMPFLSLAGWSVLIIYDLSKRDQNTAAGWSILILGTAYMLTVYNIFRLKWTNYRFKMVNGILTVLILALVSTYQGLAIFTHETVDKFLPYSAFFLNMNAIIVCSLVFLSKHENSKEAIDLL